MFRLLSYFSHITLTTLSSLKYEELFAQSFLSVYLVGLFDLVTGLFVRTHPQDNTAAVFQPCLSVTSVRAWQTHGPLTVVGETCCRALCWLTVTEMTDYNSADSSVTLLVKQSDDQSPEMWLRLHMTGLKGRQAARMTLNYFLSFLCKAHFIICTLWTRQCWYRSEANFPFNPSSCE